MCPGPCRVGAKGWCAYPLGRGLKGKAAVRVPSCLHWVLQGRGEWGGGIPGAELGGGTVSTTRTRAGLSTLCRAADAPREELPVWPWVRLVAGAEGSLGCRDQTPPLRCPHTGKDSGSQQPPSPPSSALKKHSELQNALVLRELAGGTVALSNSRRWGAMVRRQCLSGREGAASSTPLRVLSQAQRRPTSAPCGGPLGTAAGGTQTKGLCPPHKFHSKAQPRHVLPC